MFSAKALFASATCVSGAQAFFDHPFSILRLLGLSLAALKLAESQYLSLSGYRTLELVYLHTHIPADSRSIGLPSDSRARMFAQSHTRGLSDSQPLRLSASQTRRPPYSQTIRLSEAQNPRFSDSQTRRLSDSQALKLSDSQPLGLADP